MSIACMRTDPPPLCPHRMFGVHFAAMFVERREGGPQCVRDFGALQQLAECALSTLGLRAKPVGRAALPFSPPF